MSFTAMNTLSAATCDLVLPLVLRVGAEAVQEKMFVILTICYYTAVLVGTSGILSLIPLALGLISCGVISTRPAALWWS